MTIEHTILVCGREITFDLGEVLSHYSREEILPLIEEPAHLIKCVRCGELIAEDRLNSLYRCLNVYMCTQRVNMLVPTHICAACHRTMPESLMRLNNEDQEWYCGTPFDTPDEAAIECARQVLLARIFRRWTEEKLI